MGDKALPMKDMIPRRLYVLKSRNLTMGVWNETKMVPRTPNIGGFVGIREKFGDRYLFTEYHVETGPPFGTAVATLDTGIDVPPSIGLHETEPPCCDVCGQPVKWLGPPSPADWDHIANEKGCATSTADIMPVSNTNKLLFEWLEDQERSYANVVDK